MSASRRRWSYDLEQLYEDQDPGLALEAIAHLLCWLDPEGDQRSRAFELRELRGRGHIDHELTVSWDLPRLAARDPRLEADLLRFRSGRTLTLEDRPKYAAYGLALVAISCLLRRRVIDVCFYRPPDLLLDTTPSALRGVEVAGRSNKGYPAFAQALQGASGKPGKRAQLLCRNDVAEAYISLWCCDPRVAVWEKVKP